MKITLKTRKIGGYQMYEIELSELNHIYGVNDREEIIHLMQNILCIGELREDGIERMEQLSDKCE